MIISGCGSITENLSAFVDHHAKPLVEKIPSYLQDTPDFLRQLEKLKETPLPPNSFPVSIDVVGLYSNIPHKEGIECMQEALNTRSDQSVSTSFLITLLTLVLTLNIFEFDLKLYLQIIGTAMGTKVAPTYANIFMAKYDILIQQIGAKFIHFFKRFIDDVFMIWTGSEEEFLEFIRKLNEMHPTIKFTYSYNLTTRSTTFLDTQVTINQSKSIVTDLYKKETDRVQYLLPSSCHPSHIFNNIPFSLALRLVRICTERETLLKRFEELETMLISRDYPKNVIKAAIDRASKIDRKEALKRVVKSKNDRPIFVATYHPALPGLSGMIQKHWRTIKEC